MKRVSTLLIVLLAVFSIIKIAAATVWTQVPVDSNVPTKYLFELPVNVSSTAQVSSTLTVNGGLVNNGNATTTSLTITGFSGTQCLHEVSGVVGVTGSDCGSASGGTGTVTTSSAVSVNNFPFWTSASALSGTSTLTVSGASLFAGGAFNASGTITQNGTAVALQSLTVSAGGILSGGGDLSSNRTISLSTSTLYSQFSGTNLITFSTSTGAISFTTSTLYGNFSGVSPISFNSSTGAISFVNPGFVTAASSVTWTAAQTFTGGATFNATATFNSSTIIANVTSSVLAADSTGKIVPTSTVSSLGGTTGAIAVGAYLSGGSTLTVSSTLASSTWGSFTIFNNTSTNVLAKTKSTVKRTITNISCDDNTGTSTFHFFKVGALATTTNLSNITSSTLAGGIGGGTTSTFTTSTILAGEFLAVTSTVAGSPAVTNCYVESVKL